MTASHAPKVFGIGLSRTGTTSLTEALRILGLDAVHFPENLDAILAHEAATDTPVAALFAELDRAFPGSKFILTLRDRGAWLTSCEAHWARHQDYIDAAPGLADLYAQVFGASRFDRALFAAAYDRHEATVRAHFKDRPGDLLIMDLTAGDGWEKLCPFLGRPIPRAPFPSANAGTAYDGLVIRLLKASGDPAWVARVTILTEAYLRAVMDSEEYRAHDATAPLPLDDGDNFRLTLAEAAPRFGGPAGLAAVLKVGENALLPGAD